MKTNRTRAGRPGYISYVLVVSAGLMLTLATLFAYRQASNSRDVQAKVQLRNDYAEKEDTILRSIVSITPNRAMRAMMHNSDANSTSRNPLRWRNIFSDALANANARTSIPSALRTSLNVPGLITGNSGDAAISSVDMVFHQIAGVNDNQDTSFCSSGINRSLGTNYPAPLQSTNSTTIDRDRTYPIITRDKRYGNLAEGQVGLPTSSYPDFNLIPYPQIQFGYARPGEMFVAKRNWWAFAMDLANSDRTNTLLRSPERKFVISLFEIPSQLAISSSAFMSLGRYGTGDDWRNVTIDGGVYAGKAVVEGSTTLGSLSSRRGMELSSLSTIGGTSFASNPFTPGLREQYQVTSGDFYPVSLSSEGGRVAFIPINRGSEFFDRFIHTTESSTVSPTTWNNYSIGALQCAMRLDITSVTSATNRMPTSLRFSYLKGGVRQNLSIPLNTGAATGLPAGYLFACNENQTYNFGTAIVDVAYGKNGFYNYQYGVTGSVTFNNARFGDPLVGTQKSGYYKPSYPFEIKTMTSGKICVAVYPQRFRQFLTSLNADGTDVNNSLVVNVDYSTTGINSSAYRPSIPCTDIDYGLIVQECSDLSSFTKGFSLVSNLRTYIGDDFNVVPGTPPTGYTPTGTFYPPVSLFVPEKRFGVDEDPYSVRMDGQIGSLASESAATPVRPLDAKSVTGRTLGAGNVTVNLRPIRHPAELPPITMMNWLVVLSELRPEYQ